MKTKMFLAAFAAMFTFSLISCGGNKKAADAPAADECCAAKTEQVCDTAKACCAEEKKACCAEEKKACKDAACKDAACKEAANAEK
ncbi:MAG: hypothetical protein IJ511_06240 [Bacteroides sp.]|nr:hypothetical protein [Bacteroides sp.]